MPEMIKISEIKLHPMNPKIHNDDQLDRMAYIIDKLGWGRAILLSKDNYVLAGNGAVEAADTRLNIEEVPFTRREDLMHDEPEAIALMEADNKLGEYSYWDYKKLETLHGDLELSKFDLKLTGFNDIELKNIGLSSQNMYNEEGSEIAEAGEEYPTDDEWDGMPEFESEDKEGIKLVVHFPTMEDRAEFFRLIGQVPTEKTRYIWFPPQENLSMTDHIYVEDNEE